MSELRRTLPYTPVRPLFEEAVIAMLARLNTNVTLDVRDAIIVLLASRAGVVGGQVSHLDRSRIDQVDDGIVFSTDMPRRRKIFIGNPQNAVVDIRPWLTRWLEIVGRTPGPLLPFITARGEVVHDQALTVHALMKAVKRLGALAYLGPSVTAEQLRVGFVVRSTRKHGAAVVAAELGMNARSIDKREALLGGTYRKDRLRQRNQRNRWRGA